MTREIGAMFVLNSYTYTYGTYVVNWYGMQYEYIFVFLDPCFGSRLFVVCCSFRSEVRALIIACIAVLASLFRLEERADGLRSFANAGTKLQIVYCRPCAVAGGRWKRATFLCPLGT